MTYRHKREKCAPETKEILEDVFKIEKEEYGCLDCAESVRVGNPMEKILAEETPHATIKSQAETVLDEVEVAEEKLQSKEGSQMETYVSSQQIDTSETEKSLEKKKKRSYVEFRKDYRG
ncbi:MAG: hypothetical protein ACFFF4_10420 [Candidatus Thorarchaeota archaeon]